MDKNVIDQPKKKKYVQKLKYFQKIQQAKISKQALTNQSMIQSQSINKMINKEKQQVKIQKYKPKQQKTSVINVKVKFLRDLGYKSLEHWLQNPKHLYIGRNMSYYVPGAIQSKWANPFKVDKYGRQGCINQYRQYILSRKDLMNNIKSLKGKVLGCWCKPQGCHGDVLAQLADSTQ